MAVAQPAAAVTPPSPDIDVKSMAACAQGSLLKHARVGPPIRFSDRTGFDVRIVTGVYPQPSKDGAKGTMLCIYHRRSGGAEVVPAEGWLLKRMAEGATAAVAAPTAEAPSANGSIIVVEAATRAERSARASPAAAAPEASAAVSVAEHVWRAKTIDGEAVKGAVTVRFAPNGTVVGKTGCNPFSAAYDLTGNRLRVRPPFDVGKETCSPELTEQESRVQEILFLARSISQPSPTQMTVETSSGRAITFVREAS